MSFISKSLVVKLILSFVLISLFAIFAVALISFFTSKNDIKQ